MLLKRNRPSTRRGLTGFLLGLLVLGTFPQALAQPEQQIIVNIRNYTFETTQMPLQLHVPTVIYLKNGDDVRHDFGSLVFEGVIHESKHRLRLHMEMALAACTSNQVGKFPSASPLIVLDIISLNARSIKAWRVRFY